MLISGDQSDRRSDSKVVKNLCSLLVFNRDRTCGELLNAILQIMADRVIVKSYPETVIFSAIEKTVGLPARLKWPNDLLIHHKKVAGLLLENVVQKGRIRYLVLGIGVNVNLLCKTLPETLRDSVSSLREESGQVIDRIRLLQRVLETLEIQYRSFQNEPAGKILNAYTSRSETLGQLVRVQEQDHEWTGIAEGLTPEGALILRRRDREEVIIRSEEVVHVRRAHVARD